MHARDLPRLTLNFARQHQRAESELASAPRRRVERQPIVAHQHIAHAPEQRIAGFRRFGQFAANSARDPLAHTRRYALHQTELTQDLESIGKSGLIGRRWTRADDVEIVADYVREQQCFHLRGRGQARELPTFDARKVLAHAIEFVDGGPASQQKLRSGLLFCQRDGFGRQRQQRRTSAGDEAKYEVAFAGLSGDFGDPRRALYARLIGQRMPAGIELDASQFRGASVLHVHQARGNPAPQHTFGGERHRGAGLPRSHHINMMEAREIAIAKMAEDGVHRVGRGQRRAKNGLRLAA
jgi:hypothetical protein